jgi:hypothetical protein
VGAGRKKTYFLTGEMRSQKICKKSGFTGSLALRISNFSPGQARREHTLLRGGKGLTSELLNEQSETF